MLLNVPTADALDEMALRFYFDAWERNLSLIVDYAETCDADSIEKENTLPFQDDWQAYLEQAQSEMGAICALIQQSAELRLKAIICETSPYLLLDGLSYKASAQRDLDFTEQRTLDAVDLPGAVQTLTNFNLPDAYLGQYAEMRRLRNQFTHLGTHKGGLSPYKIVKILCQQYLSLWPDGRWLFRRVCFDGNSARRFFHDERWSSVQSGVMQELPHTMALMDKRSFKQAIGCSMGKMNGFCPVCMGARASKWDINGHETAFRTGTTSAKCLMCESELILKKSDEKLDCCKNGIWVEFNDTEHDPTCFSCGRS